MAKAPKIFSTDDARRLAKQRLPRMIFDFIEGAAGREVASRRNQSRFDDYQLLAKVRPITTGCRPDGAAKRTCKMCLIRKASDEADLGQSTAIGLA